MMSWFSKINPVDIAEKNRRIDELERALDNKCAEVKRLQTTLANASDKSRSATFEFDFKSVDAFSVERNINEKELPLTIVGYRVPIITPEGNQTFAIKEWYMNCDDTQHELLVKSFKESRK